MAETTREGTSSQMLSWRSNGFFAETLVEEGSASCEVTLLSEVESFGLLDSARVLFAGIESIVSSTVGAGWVEIDRFARGKTVAGEESLVDVALSGD